MSSRKTCAVIALGLLALFVNLGQAQDGSGPAAPLTHIRTVGDRRLRSFAKLTHAMILPGRDVLITANSNGLTQMWDLAGGEEIRRFAEDSSAYAWDVAAIPGADEILVACYGGWISRWSTRTGKRVAEYKTPDRPFRLAIDAPRRRFAASCSGGRCVVWDWRSGKRVAEIKGPRKADFYGLCFAEDGKTLITGSSQAKLHRWDVATGASSVLLAPPMKKDEDGEMVPDQENGPGTIRTVVPGPEDHLVLVCTSRQGLQMWDVSKGEKVWSLSDEMHDDILRAVLSDDRKTVVAISESEDCVLVVDASDGRIRRTIDLPTAESWALALSGDGQSVYCGLGRAVAVFDVASGRRTFPEADAGLMMAGPTGLGATPDGKAVYIGGYDRVVLRDLASGEAIGSYPCKGPVEQMAVAARAPVAAVLDAEGVKVSDGQGTMRLVAGRPQYGGSMFVSADGATVGVYNRYDSQIQLQDASDKVRPRVMDLPTDVECVVLSAAGQAIVLTEQCLHLVMLDRAMHVAAHDLKLDEEDPLRKGRRRVSLLGGGASGVLLAGEGQISLLRRPPQDESSPAAVNISRLLKQLGDRRYRVRARATDALVQVGPAVLDSLQTARPTSPEAAVRVEGIMRRIFHEGWRFDRRRDLSVDEVHGLAGHADGRHWVAIVGKANAPELLLGRVTADGIEEVGRIKTPDVAERVLCLPDGRVLTGNANGTVSVYRLADGAGGA